MINLRSLLLSFILFGSCHAVVATAAVVSEDEILAWQPTGLTFEYAEGNLFNDSNCKRGPITASACKAALEEMTAAAGLTQSDSIASLKQALRASNSASEAAVVGRGMNAYYYKIQDPHTRIAPVNTPATANAFIGVGLVFLQSKDGYRLTPVAHSPAAKAGILEGDQLVGVDDLRVGSAKGQVPIESVMKAIPGKQGTSVTVVVRRKGKEHRILVLRDRVVPPNVVVELPKTRGQTTALVSLAAFTKDSCNEVRSAIQKLPKNVTGIVLDLRNNPGGDLLEAACLTSLFLGADIEIAELLSSGKNPIPISQVVTKEVILSELPLVVLVNSDSASASEVVSGALQYFERAWVVGERTYGKGSFQNKLANEDLPGLTLHLTAGLYAFPDGRSPQLVGVLPDFEVIAERAAGLDGKIVVEREENHPRAVSTTKQYYGTPSNVAVRKQVSQCLQKNRVKKEMEGTKRKNMIADLQALTAIEVVSCHADAARTPLSPQAESILKSKDCKVATAYFENLKTRSSKFTSMKADIKARAEADPDGYEFSLDFYKAQWALVDQDPTDELNEAKDAIALIAQRCKLSKPAAP